LSFSLGIALRDQGWEECNQVNSDRIPSYPWCFFLLLIFYPLPHLILFVGYKFPLFMLYSEMNPFSLPYCKNPFQ
jgi:hypothetical protein